MVPRKEVLEGGGEGIRTFPQVVEKTPNVGGWVAGKTRSPPLFMSGPGQAWPHCGTRTAMGWGGGACWLGGLQARLQLPGQVPARHPGPRRCYWNNPTARTPPNISDKFPDRNARYLPTPLRRIGPGHVGPNRPRGRGGYGGIQVMGKGFRTTDA